VCGTCAIPLLVAALIALVAPSVAAAAVQVNTTADQNDGNCPADCSLRDAIALANGTSEVVLVPPGTYLLPFGPLSVSGVTVQGSGADVTTIRGVETRVLSVVGGTSSISGVTIAGGTAADGAGILVGLQTQATLALSNSAVTGNVASSSNASGGGIAVQSSGVLLMTGSTVSGNRVIGEDGRGIGGGIFVERGGRAEIRNSTVSGNLVDELSTPGIGGGIATTVSGVAVLENVTVAFNSAEIGGGLAQDQLSPGSTATISDTIVAGNAGADCNPTPLQITGDHNLADDSSCGFASVANPLLGSLQINTGVGRTATHALLPGSPAINAGDPATCKPTDQRGAPRPAGACDIGAFEYVVPTLRVIMSVVNDHGGIRSPADFNVHMRQGPGDVAGSPQPGTANGTTYTLPVGSYTVSVDAKAGYAMTVSGDCAADGTLTLQENQAKTCIATANDVALPPPVIRKRLNVLPKSGIVKIKRPGSKRFVLLEAGRQVPMGTIVDTLKGRVTLVVAANKKGKTATADFYEGIFKVRQTKGAKPTTRLILTEKLSCRTAGKATTAAKKKRKRRLWGDGKGRFRTQGEYSSATVRGTIWLTQDHCDRTWTKVIRGKVAVRDFRRKKTIIVRAGKQYIARAKKR
jgi:CSLREA domain-containing protein